MGRRIALARASEQVASARINAKALKACTAVLSDFNGYAQFTLMHACSVVAL